MLLAAVIFYGLLTFVLVAEAVVVGRLIMRGELRLSVVMVIAVVSAGAAAVAVKAGVAVVSILCVAALVGPLAIISARKRAVGGGGASAMQRAQRIFEESDVRWREAHRHDLLDEGYRRRNSPAYSNLIDNIWHRAP